MGRYLSIALLSACTYGGSKDSEEKSTDTGTADDTDRTEHTGEVSTKTSGLTGRVIGFDGINPGDLAVTACQELNCYSGRTDANGSFEFTNIGDGPYKVDAIGEGADGKTYGHVRIPVELVVDQTLALPLDLLLPNQPSYQSVRYDSSGSHTFDGVVITVDGPDIVEESDDDPAELSVGMIDGPDFPAYWTESPDFALTLLPFDQEVYGAFDVAVKGAWAGESWEVFAVDAHGDLEMVGTAARDGEEVVATDLKPAILSWLLFVPA